MLAPAHLLAATSFLIGSASAQEALIAAPAITSKRKWMTSAQQTIAQHKRQATGADGIGGNATTQDQTERTARRVDHESPLGERRRTLGDVPRHT